jgi:hypothetical protein
LRNGNGLAVGLTVTTAVVGGATVATITFGGSLTEFGSLGDGTYTLTVSSAQVSGGLAAGDYTASLFRLFGDATGDGTVNVSDLTLFRAAFGAASSDFTFDFDGDGVISVSDLIAFRAHYGASAGP